MVGENVSLVPYYTTRPSRKSEQGGDLSAQHLKAKLLTFPIPRSQLQAPRFGSCVHPGHISCDHEQGIFAKKEIQAGWPYLNSLEDRV